MHNVYTHHDRFMVLQVKELLDLKGISCFVKNEFVMAAIGELSAMDVLPEVWTNNSKWLPKGKQFITDFQHQSVDTNPWGRLNH